jgi:peptide subunit release factor 1 (eRF1)
MYQQSGAAQRDRFARKLEDHQIRFIAHASQDVARLAQAQGWERVVVAGDPRLTEPLEAELPPAIEPLIVRGTFQWQRPHELVEAVAPEVERAAGERMARLVSEARERAGAGGHGALGLAEVLDALVQGRVDTLIVDPSCAPAGVRAPDGRLAPAGQGLPGASADELEPEPHLVERMVELALETSGRVVPVQAEAAAELADVDGVAAILRW